LVRVSLQFTCRGRAHRNSFTDIAKTTLHHHQQQKMTFASATTCKRLYIHDPSARFEVYIIGDVCTPFPKHDSSEKPTHRLGPNTRNTYLTSNANFDNVVNAFCARTGLVVVVRHAREDRTRASHHPSSICTCANKERNRCPKRHVPGGRPNSFYVCLRSRSHQH
jgi:hypothetical protein